MTDATLNTLVERDFDEPRRRVVLQKNPRVELCLLAQCVTLVESDDAGVTRAREIDQDLHLQLQPTSWQTTVHLAEHSFSLARSRLRDALELIATGRLLAAAAAAGRATRQFDADSRLVTKPELVESAALRWLLEEEETLLAWLPTSLSLAGQSSALGRWRADAWFLMTEQRTLLVALSRTGDVESVELPQTELEIRGKDIQCGSLQWTSRELESFQLLQTACVLTGTERLLEVARQLWIAKPSSPEKALVYSWLQKACKSPAARLLSDWLRLVPDDHSRDQSLIAAAETAGELGELWQRWQLPVSAGRALLSRLPREARYEVLARELSGVLWETQRAKADTPVTSTQADLDHAELLLAYGATAQATPILTARRAQLPELSLADIELPSGLDPSPLRNLRQRLEKLAGRAQQDTHAKTQTWQRLVALDPLNPSWLQQLADSGEQPVAERARLALEVLHAPTQDVASRANLGMPHALTDEFLSALPHPMVAEHRQLLSKVQAAIAKIQTPDFDTLKLYCERITRNDSEVVSAVDAAATLLSLGHVDVYISRGHDDVGCRAFKNQPNKGQSAFLLLGGQHVDTESRYFMNPTQLRFVVASELAHVRFEHTRVAPKDVLSGVWDKGKQGLDIALSVLPILKGIGLASRIGMVTTKLSLPQLGRAMTAARALTRAVDKAQGKTDDQRSDISTANEELILAHRLMQLSADRAGLLCCQDFRAAVAALVISRSDYVRAATELPTLGALKAIKKQRHGHGEAYDDLLTRLGELTSFYISDNYELLRAAAYDQS